LGRPLSGYVRSVFSSAADHCQSRHR
jgi:hypothetical protein